MDVSPRTSPTKKRKSRYIPHKAAAEFKPDDDWTKGEAKKAYSTTSFDFPVDVINYEDCIQGMRKLPEESIDVVIADPPFGIGRLS